MKHNSKVAAAIAAILSAQAAHAVYAADQEAQTTATEANAGALTEVIVTAERRSESIQNVPISIQALTGEQLQQLNVTTFADFVKYLPSVSTGSMGPGQEVIFMRGLSVGVLGTQGQGSVGGFPNVAVYLDDQSAQLPGRNLDIYAVDLERIEVLEGPQGTLFGAGAQAGVVRYITNKPKLNVTEGNVDAGYGTTTHGDNSADVNATINLPIIQDKLAVRAVIYTDSRGGYIRNLPSTFARGPSDLGIVTYFGGKVPANSVSINNYQLASNSPINPLTYSGIRVSALYQFNDDWNLLLAQSYQNMNAQGVFYEMPYGSAGAGLTSTGTPIGGTPLPPLSVTLFNPSFTRDKFENTALSVNGKIGSLNFVYTGAYLVRNIDQVQDYTNYARGLYGVYYQCTNVFNQKAGVQCFSPSSTWHDTERNTHLSQEIRVSTPTEWRIRGLGGLFYEDYEIGDDTEWLYRSVPQCSPPTAADPTSNVDCFLPIQPWPGPANDPNIRNSSTGFFDDFKRGYTQQAVFGSADVDILPKVLTITGGLRYFDIHNKTSGGDVGSFSCYQYAPTTYYGPCPAPYGTDLNLQNPNHQVSTGIRGRGNLTWHVTQDAMLYYTYSQGFRAGGFNRGTSARLFDADGKPQYNTPLDFLSDDLTNNEIGWKTEWLDHHLLFNGAVYQENWSNVQVGFFCPQCGLGNLTFGTNGPDYRVRGVEFQLSARVWQGLSINAAAAWNSTEQTNSPYLIDNVPGSPNFGKPILYARKTPTSPLVAQQNVFGVVGTPLANSPPFDGNLRVRYDWALANDLNPFVYAGVQHQSHSISATGTIEAYDQPGWTTYDATAGVSKDAWTVDLVGTNITNTNASLFTSSRQFILTEVPMRPRTIYLRFHYNFGGK